MTTQLLCTFSTVENLNIAITDIRQTYTVVYANIYILQNKLESDNLYVTYNIDCNYTPEIPLYDTILIHRKKETNTLYTINALNSIVKEQNNGIVDSSFMINWELLRNCIILTNTDGIKKIHTKIYDILKVD